jgi:UrcA family protein
MRPFLNAAAALMLATPLAAAAAFSAQAAPDRAVAVRVSYADLDLDRTSDAAAMLQRLQEASLQACGASSFSLPDYRLAVGRSNCYSSNMDVAVASIGAPVLSELYKRRAPIVFIDRGHDRDSAAGG